MLRLKVREPADLVPIVGCRTTTIGESRGSSTLGLSDGRAASLQAFVSQVRGRARSPTGVTRRRHFRPEESIDRYTPTHCFIYI